MFHVNPRTASGFSIGFANGYTISVQWGRSTYSDNQTPANPFADYELRDAVNCGAVEFWEGVEKMALESKTAEVAVFKTDGPFVAGWNPNDMESSAPAGWFKPEEVIRIAVWVASWPPA